MNVYGLTLVLVGIAVTAIGCSSGNLPSDLDQTSVAQAAVADLSLGQNVYSVNVGGTASLYPLGGVPPYTYSVGGNLGTVNATTNVFTAGAAAGSADITVMDFKGTTQKVTIVIIAPVASVETVVAAAPATIPWMRFYFASAGLHMDHVVNATTAYWVKENDVGRLLTTKVAGSTELYQCEINTGTTKAYFDSVQANCEGYKVVGVLGYIYTSQVANSTAIYRHAAFTAGIFGKVLDHLNTNSGTAPAGYRTDGILGYAPNM